MEKCDTEKGCTALQLLAQAFEIFKKDTLENIMGLREDIIALRASLSKLTFALLTASITFSIAAVGWVVTLLIMFVKEHK